MAASPAGSPSLADAAYRRIRDDIVSCRLAPGQRLTERGLADLTGFGRSPIRDALTRLDHEGLVRTLPRKGYQVTPLTLKSIDDLFTLWQIVGPEIARLGVRDATPEQHRLLVERFRELAAEVESPQQDEVPLRRTRIAAEAFGTLAEATRNDYLISMFRRLDSDLARIWALAFQADTPVPEFTIDVRWLGVVERRDGDAAAAAVSASISDMHNHTLRVFSRWPSVAASEITPLNA